MLVMMIRAESKQSPKYLQQGTNFVAVAPRSVNFLWNFDTMLRGTSNVKLFIA